MQGSVTVQVPATENYSASNRIAMYTADGSTSSMIASTGGGVTTGSTYEVRWSYTVDTSTENDGFSSSSWLSGPYASGFTQDQITGNLSNGTWTNQDIANDVRTWLQDNPVTGLQWLGGLAAHGCASLIFD